MRSAIEAGNILIREGCSLPEGLGIEREPCVPGWAIVKDLDGYALDRKIRPTGWTFFCLAREMKATVFGFNKEKMARRAVERILANPKSEKFNSLEVTRVASKGTHRFPFIGYATVSAHSRHIQESAFLSQPKNLATAGMKSPSASQDTRMTSGLTQLSQEAIKEPVSISIAG